MQSLNNSIEIIKSGIAKNGKKCSEMIESVFFNDKHGRRCAKFRCFNCETVFMYSVSVMASTGASCGCVSGNIKHKLTQTKEYRTWNNMLNRCRNKNTQSFIYYGGRGINVDQRWEFFENFIKDMGNSPSKNHSIDRIDPNKNYCKENCRWATKKEQNNNKRNNIFLEFYGEIKTLAEWAEIFEVPKTRFHLRRSNGFIGEEIILGRSFSL